MARSLVGYVNTFQMSDEWCRISAPRQVAAKFDDAKLLHLPAFDCGFSYGKGLLLLEADVQPSAIFVLAICMCKL